MDRQDIIREIRRTAEENGGRALGRARFEKTTRIRTIDWYGKYWKSWGDALAEAGLEANTMQGAYSDDRILGALAALTRELGAIPVEGDLMLKRRQDTEFPSKDVFRRLGPKAQRLRKLLEYCGTRSELGDVAAIVQRGLQQRPSVEATDKREPRQELGYVYLVKHGSRQEYKIGRTNNPLRREGEIAIELPELATPVHVIETDDPAGVEHYWHRRFAAKRKRGEWFELNAEDVSAFKKWRRIA